MSLASAPASRESARRVGLQYAHRFVGLLRDERQSPTDAAQPAAGRQRVARRERLHRRHRSAGLEEACTVRRLRASRLPCPELRRRAVSPPLPGDQARRRVGLAAAPEGGAEPDATPPSTAESRALARAVRPIRTRSSTSPDRRRSPRSSARSRARSRARHDRLPAERLVRRRALGHRPGRPTRSRPRTGLRRTTASGAHRRARSTERRPRADIGASDVFYSTCYLVRPSRRRCRRTWEKTFGPVQVMNFAVPQSSTQQSISLPAAYYVFGFGGGAYPVPPWTDPDRATDSQCEFGHAVADRGGDRRSSGALERGSGTRRALRSAAALVAAGQAGFEGRQLRARHPRLRLPSAERAAAPRARGSQDDRACGYYPNSTRSPATTPTRATATTRSGVRRTSMRGSTRRRDCP